MQTGGCRNRRPCSKKCTSAHLLFHNTGRVGYGVWRGAVWNHGNGMRLLSPFFKMSNSSVCINKEYKKGVAWNPGMQQLLTPPSPAHSSGGQALIIRPAFSTSSTCHPPIWSKELTNREMFRPKYQCWWPACCLLSILGPLLSSHDGGGRHGGMPDPSVLGMPHLLEHAHEPVSELGHEGNKGLGMEGAL